jgi:hypothetical protein
MLAVERAMQSSATMSENTNVVGKGRGRWAVPVTLGMILASAGGCADNVDEPVETGEVSSPLPKCGPDSTAPICNPGDPVCKPRCSGKVCGAADGCGGVCKTGSCPVPNETCGGGGVPAQCGHASADLRPWQTGFRNQGGRDTCTVFATTAAVEAAYKHRYGLDLDLSEQFLHHFQKSLWLDSSAQLPTPDIQPENNGGGNITWQMAALTRYGLPLESTLPYIGDGAWQNLDAWTAPMGSLVRTNQRALDDFMLSATATTYFTPGAITATVLPQAALAGARYRPTSIKQASGSDFTNLAWYKNELKAGREIAFQVNLTRPDPTNDGIWDPGPNAWGSHAMLMVGFDDLTQIFYVKNQWGGTDFDKFSYSWVTGGYITDAATILDVANPYTAFGPNENKHLVLGRWNLDYDGWRGTLDIYRLPGDGSPSAPDRRVGTYFGPDGVARRVSAAITGNRIDFYIDMNNPNQPANVLQGVHFTTYVYAQEPTVMAGTLLGSDGNTWNVTAQKNGWLSGVPRYPAVLSRAAYYGRWELDTDGVKGTLRIDANASSGIINGSYTTAGGNVFGVTGQVTADPRIFSLSVYDGTAVTSYTGYLNGHALGIMSGSAVRNGSGIGFHAVRLGDP